MRWSIVGPGALGTLLAAHLAQSGEEVLLLGHRTSALSGELTVSELAGERWQARVATGRLAEAQEPADVVVVLVKAGATAVVLPHLPALLAPDGLLLTLQNGLGHQQLLAEAVGPARALVGSTAQGATLLSPGQVRHAGSGQTQIGWYEGRGPARAIARIAGQLDRAGWACQVVGDMRPVLWLKLAVNCAINPLTGLLRVPNGELLVVPGARELMRAAAYEVAAIADRQAIQLEVDPAERAIAVAQATAANRSSLLQDLERGRVTEIDAICGAVVQHAAALGLPAPINRELWAQIRRLEGRPAPP